MAIIEEIRQGNQDPLFDLYKQYRNHFIKWAMLNYSVNEEEAKDVFQEVIIAFNDKVVSGKLVHLSADVRTYLFAIGKFHLLNLIKRKKRQVTFDDLQLINVVEPTENTMESKEEQEFVRETVKKLLDTQCADCKKVLELYYFHELSMDEIAGKMGYKNADVAKKKKYECFKKLAAIAKDKLMLFAL